MGELVALDLPAGPTFVDALRAAWDAGDAVLPVDPRLPTPAADRLLDSLRPSRVVTSDGTQPRRGALPIEPGDALVVPTSGTSGQPKGVVHTHASVAASAVAISAADEATPDRYPLAPRLPLAI